MYGAYGDGDTGGAGGDGWDTCGGRGHGGCGRGRGGDEGAGVGVRTDTQRAVQEEVVTPEPVSTVRDGLAVGRHTGAGHGALGVPRGVPGVHTSMHRRREFPGVGAEVGRKAHHHSPDPTSRGEQGPSPAPSVGVRPRLDRAAVVGSQVCRVVGGRAPSVRAPPATGATRHLRRSSTVRSLSPQVETGTGGVSRDIVDSVVGHPGTSTPSHPHG